MCVSLCFVLIRPPLHHCPPPFLLPCLLLDSLLPSNISSFLLVCQMHSMRFSLKIFLPHFMNTQIYIIYLSSISSLGAKLEIKNCLSEFGLLGLTVISNCIYFLRRRRQPSLTVARTVVLCGLYRNQCDVFSKQLKLEPHHS